jgi:putative phosphoesterase
MMLKYIVRPDPFPEASSMRIAVLSDLHANPPALRAVLDDAGAVDAIFCLGDLVDYGPQPKEVIATVRRRATKAIRGNHDQALAFDMDCCCAEAFRPLSVGTRLYHKTLLGRDEVEYLKSLPLSDSVTLAGSRFFLCHASPQGDLFRYLRPNTPEETWRSEIVGVDADVIFTGHTHLPMIKRIGKTTIVNPGSVGQPRDNDPRAAYALWNDGEITLRRAAYPVEETIAALRRSPLEQGMVERLSAILRNGK